MNGEWFPCCRLPPSSGASACLLPFLSVIPMANNDNGGDGVLKRLIPKKKHNPTTALFLQLEIPRLSTSRSCGSLSCP